MTPQRRRAQLAAAERADTRDARAAAAARTVDEGLRDALALLALTASELGVRARGRDAWARALRGDEPADLARIWRDRHASHRG